MDLKLVDVSVASDAGIIEGTGLDLVVDLREIALSDTLNFIEQELSIDKGEYEDTGEDFVDESLLEDSEDDFESYERQPVAEIEDLPETSDETTEVDYSTIYDFDMGMNLSKSATVISFFDNIIKTNGVVEDTVDVQYIINKFKELDGVINTYGDFVISTSFTTV